MSATFPLDFSYAYGAPVSTAIFRQKNEDFIVHEDLGFEPSGSGEHLYLQIKKSGENTSWVAEKLAKYFAVKDMDVSYCGKKDRNAETCQWFSIYLPGAADPSVGIKWENFPQACGFNGEVLNACRHERKLRRGAHKANIFQIRLREVTEPAAAIAQLGKIKEHGVPNYFGEQRFGHNGSNLDFAGRWFGGGEKIKNRGKRSMVMSAARSYLFNQVLSARVDQNTWRECLSGDPLAEDKLASGPLWGRGRLKSAEQTLALESSVLEKYADWCEHLEHLGLLQERRPLVLTAFDLRWHEEDSAIVVAFGLPPGQYATALLREVFLLKAQDQ